MSNKIALDDYSAPFKAELLAASYNPSDLPFYISLAIAVVILLASFFARFFI